MKRKKVFGDDPRIRLLRISSFVFCVISSFTLFIFLFIYSMVKLSGNESVMNFLSIRTNNQRPETSSYQYLTFNSKTRTVNQGVATSFIKLGENGYVSYNDDVNGDYLLFSPVGSKEYLCIGSCYCDDHENNERRMSFSSLSTYKMSLFFLVSAVSTIVAMELAKERFQNSCMDRMHDTCSLSTYSSVRSEVDSCVHQSSKSSDDDIPSFFDTDIPLPSDSDIPVVDGDGFYGESGGEPPFTPPPDSSSQVRETEEENEEIIDIKPEKTDDEEVEFYTVDGERLKSLDKYYTNEEEYVHDTFIPDNLDKNKEYMPPPVTSSDPKPSLTPNDQSSEPQSSSSSDNVEDVDDVDEEDLFYDGEIRARIRKRLGHKEGTAVAPWVEDPDLYGFDIPKVPPPPQHEPDTYDPESMDEETRTMWKYYDMDPLMDDFEDEESINEFGLWESKYKERNGEMTDEGMVKEWDPTIYDKDGNSVYYDYDKPLPKILEDDEFYENEFVKEKTRVYECKGRCIPNIFADPNSVYPHEFVEDENYQDCLDFDCDGLKLHMKVLIDERPYYTEEGMKEAAETYFMELPLKMYCRKFSWKKVMTDETVRCKSDFIDDPHELDECYDVQNCENCEHSIRYQGFAKKPMCNSEDAMGENESVSCVFKKEMWDGETKMKFTR